DDRIWPCRKRSGARADRLAFRKGAPDPMPSTPRRADPEVDLRQCVEGGDGISVIRGGGNCRSWNNIQYRVGLSAKNVGSSKLSMNVATIPPGGIAYAHIHVGFELMLYILQGRVRHEYGPGLRRSVENEAGDFIYIEPGVT